MRDRILLIIAAALVASWQPILADEPSSVDNAWGLSGMPRMRLPPGKDWYAPQAKRLGLEGRVLVAFDITTAGVASNVSVIWAEDDLLGANTTGLLSGAHFDVPKDWATSGAGRRWRAGFIYCLVPSGQSDEFAIPVQKIYLTATRIPGAPVHKRGSGGCAGEAH